MTGIRKYRNIYVIVGIIFAVIITQSSLDDRTQRMVLLAYIVLGFLVTEFIGRTILKKKEHEKIEVKGINMSWNIYVIVAIVFGIVITQSSFSAGTQVTLLLAYIVLGFLVTELIVRTILKKEAGI